MDEAERNELDDELAAVAEAEEAEINALVAEDGWWD